MSDRRSHHEGDDSKGYGHRIGHDAEENRESHRQKNSSRLEQGKSRTREEEHNRGSTDRDYRHREHHKDRSTRDERGADRLNDRNHRRSSRDERNRDHGRESDKRHRQSSYSHSREKSRNRSGSHSRSRSPAKSKRASGFDMAPPGVSATPIISPGQLPTVSQPVAGMFPNMFPFAAPNLGSVPLIPLQVMTQQATRHARRVYVGGLPPMANEQTIATFFSQVMSAIGGNTSGPGDAVVNVYINHEKKFAFVEMRTVEEASNAMSLDGITFEGVAVRVRRPTDYNPSLAASLGPSQPNPHLNLSAIGLTPGILGGAEGPDRIFVGGLPYYFTETQIRELLESFGTLRGFDLVKDRDTGNSKGYGFCVYQDSAVTDIACAALNGLKMGDKTLTVRRATVSGQVKPEQEMILQQAQQHIAIQKIVLQSSGATLPGLGLITNASSPVPTKVICLTEVISVEDLRDDEEYTEILEDMREESGKFGSLVNVVIPRPSSTGDVVSGVGKVFLEYNDTSGSARAKAALHGRKFGGNTVTAFYYPEDKFSSGDYNYITAEN